MWRRALSQQAAKWTPPARAQDTYKFLGSAPHDVAGARTEKPLPQRGYKDYQLYSFNTPNGRKVGIALEEFAVDYDAHVIDLHKGDQFTSGFVGISPNSKIPVLQYKDDMAVFESGAILLYLADKHSMLIPPSINPKRAECYSWLMWQMSAQGPMFGQFMHFYKHAPRDKIEAINYGVARYSMETRRLLSVMENHLAKDHRNWWLGPEFSICDIACFPWLDAVANEANDFLQVEAEFPAVKAWRQRMLTRPAVKRGMLVCKQQ